MRWRATDLTLLRTDRLPTSRSGHENPGPLLRGTSLRRSGAIVAAVREREATVDLHDGEAHAREILDPPA